MFTGLTNTIVNFFTPGGESVGPSPEVRREIASPLGGAVPGRSRQKRSLTPISGSRARRGSGPLRTRPSCSN